nr:probable pectate lyase 8 [Tanacetum cinerariifolium]
MSSLGSHDYSLTDRKDGSSFGDVYDGGSGSSGGLRHMILVDSGSRIYMVNVLIANGDCLTIQFVTNIIIHGLHIYDCKPTGYTLVRSSPSHYGWRAMADGDAISIFGSSLIGVDHNSISNCANGLVDAVITRFMKQYIEGTRLSSWEDITVSSKEHYGLTFTFLLTIKDYCCQKIDSLNTNELESLKRQLLCKSYNIFGVWKNGLDDA